MRRSAFAHWPLLAMIPLFAIVSPARAVTSCAAANPNTSSVTESTPTSDFTINGNGTVTHAKTGLMWKQCEEGLSGATCATGPATTMTWANALAAANTANTAAYAGFTDWRLPNIKELESIVELCGFNPAINLTVFPNTLASVFWSGTSYSPFPADAWGVRFFDGDAYVYDNTLSLYARLVRGGDSADSFDLLDSRTTVDLSIAMSHTGNFSRGRSGASFTIVVNNVGGLASNGSVVSVTNTLSAGLSTSALSGGGWTCTLGTLTCTRSDVLGGGASYPPITLTISVASNAPGSVGNTATVSGGGDFNFDNNTVAVRTGTTPGGSAIIYLLLD